LSGQKNTFEQTKVEECGEQEERSELLPQIEEEQDLEEKDPLQDNTEVCKPPSIRCLKCRGGEPFKIHFCDFFYIFVTDFHSFAMPHF
jgi:hypothetical protein